MTPHNRLYANRRVATVLDAIIRACKPGDLLKTADLANRLNTEDARRYFTQRRVGMILRQHEDLVYLRDGRWVVK